MYTITLKSKDNNYFEYNSNKTDINEAVDEAFESIKQKQWEHYMYYVYDIKIKKEIIC